MTAFYKTFKKTSEINDEEAPVWRAIQYNSVDRNEILKLCQEFNSERLLIDGDYIVENPYMDEVGLSYYILPKHIFTQEFKPFDPGPYILSGGVPCGIKPDNNV